MAHRVKALAAKTVDPNTIPRTHDVRTSMPSSVLHVGTVTCLHMCARAHTHIINKCNKNSSWTINICCVIYLRISLNCNTRENIFFFFQQSREKRMLEPEKHVINPSSQCLPKGWEQPKIVLSLRVIPLWWWGHNPQLPRSAYSPVVARAQPASEPPQSQYNRFWVPASAVSGYIHFQSSAVEFFLWDTLRVVGLDHPSQILVHLDLQQISFVPQEISRLRKR